MEEVHGNSGIAAAVNSIYRTLEERLSNQYNLKEEKLKEIANNILSIHGMDKESFSVIKQIERLFNEKLNDASLDDNSNKNSKTTEGIIRESLIPFNKIIGYRALYRKMAEIYGKKEATYLSSLMYDYTLAISDSSKILIPYCWAFDSSKLNTMGKPTGQLHSKPAKRLDSYSSLLNEVIHTMSNSLAGAIAVGTLFLDIAYLLLMKENKTIEDLKNKDYRKYIENQYQKIVYGFNSLSRSGGVESPFTNISLFDREKLKKLINEEYTWYYQEEREGELLFKYSPDYIIEFIIELQNIFMEFFDEGDPLNDGMPYRFPVATLNISKKRNREGHWTIEDKQFLKSVCKKDIYRYNVFVSEGNKVASCCRLLSDQDKVELASQANSFGAGGSISLGSHRVICINFARLALIATNKEEYENLIKTSVFNCKKILFAHKQMLRDQIKTQEFMQVGWIQLDRMFSTIGIIGYVEAEDILKNKKIFLKNEDVMFNSLKILNNSVINENEQFLGCFFNIEQVPGESMSHRLPRADKFIFGDNQPFNLYSNQFIPLWDRNTNIWDKMKNDGKYLSLLTGGGISHITVGEHITSKQAEKLINYAVECNLEHFALTGVFCKCEEGHVTIGNKELCLLCGKKIINRIARVVGFFTPIEDWSTYKINYDFKRRKEFKNGDLENEKTI